MLLYYFFFIKFAHRLEYKRFMMMHDLVCEKKNVLLYCQNFIISRFMSYEKISLMIFSLKCDDTIKNIFFNAHQLNSAFMDLPTLIFHLFSIYLFTVVQATTAQKWNWKLFPINHTINSLLQLVCLYGYWGSFFLAIFFFSFFLLHLLCTSSL